MHYISFTKKNFSIVLQFFLGTLDFFIFSARSDKKLTCEPSSVPPTIRNPNPESWRCNVTVSSTKDSPGLLLPDPVPEPLPAPSRGHRVRFPGKGSLCSKLVLSFRTDRGNEPARNSCCCCNKNIKSISISRKNDKKNI